MKFIFRLLKCFRFARKRLGGTWYYVEVIDSAGGIEGPLFYWTQFPDTDEIVIKKENHEQEAN
jgi:hypothetical protein